MATEEDPDRKDSKLNPYLRFGGMVFQMLTVILLAAWGGSYLDKWVETSKPYFTLGCAFAGVILSMVMVIRDIKKTK